MGSISGIEVSAHLSAVCLKLESILHTMLSSALVVCARYLDPLVINDIFLGVITWEVGLIRLFSRICLPPRLNGKAHSPKRITDEPGSDSRVW